MASYIPSYPASTFQNLLMGVGISRELLGQPSMQRSVVGTDMSMRHQLVGTMRHVGIGFSNASDAAVGSLSEAGTSSTSGCESLNQLVLVRTFPSLSHGPNVRDIRDTPPEENFSRDDVDPGVCTGRGPTISPVEEEQCYEKRIYVSPAIGEDKFEQNCANTTISALLRELFKGDATWDEVSKQTRDALFEGFCRRFRWDPSKDNEIILLWEKVCRTCYVNMIAQAKRLYQKSRKRMKWCAINQYHRLVRHWENPDVIADSLKHSKNRGVIRDTEGNVLKGAPGTFTGGSKSMVSRDKQLLIESSSSISTRKLVQTVGNFKVTHMKGMRKNAKRRKRQQQGTDSANESSPAELENTPSQEPQWINSEYEKIVELYYKYLEEKYVDMPQDKPGEWDPRDEECWSKACGGVKKGKVIGVSNRVILEDLGYKPNRRPQQTGVNQSTEFINNTIQLALEAMNAKFDEERQLREAQFAIERQTYQAQIAGLRGETHTVMNDLLSRLPPLDREVNGTEDGGQ